MVIQLLASGLIILHFFGLINRLSSAPWRAETIKSFAPKTFEIDGKNIRKVTAYS